MFENIMKFFKKIRKKEEKIAPGSREAAKERLHLVLMQDRANVSADFLELMKQEIIEVIKKYIDIDEGAIDVRLTNKENEDGTNGAPALYANIPIINIKNEARKLENKAEEKAEEKKQEAVEDESNNIENIEKDKIEDRRKDNIENNTEDRNEIQEDNEKVAETKENIENLKDIINETIYNKENEEKIAEENTKEKNKSK